MNPYMKAQENRKLRIEFLTSEERRQLRSLRKKQKPHREVSMQPSDYCLFQSDDILKLVEDHVSKNGWNW
jgi:hypothetical protein